jgi:hypothetical protein
MLVQPHHLEWFRRRLFNAARRRCPGLSPRRWSNAELRRWGPLFVGDVVNVSAWRDEDKEGGHYRSYFPNAASYTMTNYWGSASANDGHPGAHFLDLQGETPESLRGRFDVALAHTVLEHVYDVRRAIANIAALTRDAMILIVPFSQDEHYSGSLYGDYWRMTPLGMKRAVEEQGFTLLHLAANDTPWYPIYLFGIASCLPEKWAGRFPPIDWERRIGRSVFVYPNAAW